MMYACMDERVYDFFFNNFFFLLSARRFRGNRTKKKMISNQLPVGPRTYIVI